MTPRLIETVVFCNFSQFRDFTQKLRSVRGFVRVWNHQGKVLRLFAKSVDYEWATNTMRILGEEQAGGEYLDVRIENGLYVLNEASYDTDILPDLEYIAKDDTIQFFDANNRPITEVFTIDRVTVNDVAYEDMVELTTAIEAL